MLLRTSIQSSSIFGHALQAKVEMFVTMQQLLQSGHHTSPDLASCSEKLIHLMTEHVGEHHSLLRSCLISS